MTFHDAHHTKWTSDAADNGQSGNSFLAQANLSLPDLKGVFASYLTLEAIKPLRSGSEGLVWARNQFLLWPRSEQSQLRPLGLLPLHCRIHHDIGVLRRHRRLRRLPLRRHIGVPRCPRHNWSVWSVSMMALTSLSSMCINACCRHSRCPCNMENTRIAHSFATGRTSLHNNEQSTGADFRCARYSQMSQRQQSTFLLGNKN